MSEPEAPAATRGRPRPGTTVERDEKVYSFIASAPASTRAAIAAGTELPGNEVYLSLYRLSRATPPRIVKTGAKWSVVGAEAPVEEPAVA
jgi:hypothetical protein